MNLSEDNPNAIYTLYSYAPGIVDINRRKYRKSLIVSPDLLIENWAPASIEQLKPEDFDIILTHNPEFILLGTGPTQVFPPHECFAHAYKAQVPIEVMSTSAAVKTFAILAAEKRRFMAGLIL